MFEFGFSVVYFSMVLVRFYGVFRLVLVWFDSCFDFRFSMVLVWFAFWF